MQVAKVCIVGCFAVSRSARIGLIVLALAIAVVGAGAVGMAFLPAAVTEPVVKPVTQSVELLTGDDKPETITVDLMGSRLCWVLAIIRVFSLGPCAIPRIQA